VHIPCTSHSTSKTDSKGKNPVAVLAVCAFHNRSNKNNPYFTVVNISDGHINLKKYTTQEETLITPCTYVL
jgi:hypothetical protein